MKINEGYFVVELVIFMIYIICVAIFNQDFRSELMGIYFYIGVIRIIAVLIFVAEPNLVEMTFENSSKKTTTEEKQ